MSFSPTDSALFFTLFSSTGLADLFTDEAYVKKLVEVEGALALVQAKLGVIPEAAAQQINVALPSFKADMAQLAAATEKSSIPTIELLRQLREHVGEDAASYLHWGATSQDIMDTAVVLQCKEALGVMEKMLDATLLGLGVLAEKHRFALMAGRTHSQQALPITFGLKIANWLTPLLRHKERLAELKARVFVVQFGGAVGTLASLRDKGIAVQEALAVELGLAVPLLPWHTQRDNFVELANWLSLMSGSLAKLAQDVILMAQTEIAELRESNDASRGSSSTMPQKANPVQSELILTAARQNAQHLAAMHQAQIQEHERGTHGWQLEWLNLAQMFALTGSSLEKTLWLSQNLVVNEARMLENVKASQGLMMAEAASFELSKHRSRSEAKALVKRAVQKSLQHNKHLAETLSEESELALNWFAILDETSYLGETQTLIDRVTQELKRLMR